jgi:hypothetical protein
METTPDRHAGGRSASTTGVPVRAGEGRRQRLELVGELRPRAPQMGPVVVTAVDEETGERAEAVVDVESLDAGGDGL